MIGSRALADIAASKPHDVRNTWTLKSLDVAAAGRPNSWVRRYKNRDHRGSYRRGKMRNPRIVADIHASLRQPASQFVEIVKADRVFEGLFRSGAPPDGNS